MKLVPIAAIDLNASPKVRAELNADAIADYAELYKKKANLPPLVLFEEGERLLLADGRHRIEAALRAGFKDIACEIKRGDYEACLRYALLANNESGVRPTAQDQREAVLSAIKEWPDKTQSEIAQVCGVSQGFVCKVRKKSLLQTTGEKIIPEIAKNTSAQKDKPASSKQMPARRDKSEEIEFRTPPPIPAVLRANIRSHLDEADRILNGLLHRQDIPCEVLRILGRLNTEVHHAQVLLQPELPGLVVDAAPKAKGKATREEVQNYCAALILEQDGQQIRLTRNDGDWFHDKMTGCGWKNAGKAVQDYEATVRAWARMRLFPSQKNGNGGKGTRLSGAEMILRKSELDSAEHQMAVLKSQLEGQATWSPKEKERYQTLASRRKELKEMLGIKV